MKYFIQPNDAAGPMMIQNRLLFDMLKGEEKPKTMAVLLLLLVIAWHLAGFYFVNANTSVTPAKPQVIMEVSMVAVPLPVADVPPPAPAPPTPPEPPKPAPPVPKPVPPKPVVKPVVKKPLPKPVIHKTEPIFIPVAKEPTPLPITAPTPAPVKATPASVKAAPAPVKAAPAPSTFTQASVGANYGYNPKPKYPSVARSRGWEGKVILQVHVSADGEAEQVSVSQSSGHDILDEAAVSAVEGWRFVPAKRGDTAVASTVNVPINFKLDN
jgi:protein TonB